MGDSVGDGKVIVWGRGFGINCGFEIAVLREQESAEVGGCEIGTDGVGGDGVWKGKTWEESAAYKEEEWEREGTHHPCKMHHACVKIGMGFLQEDWC